MSCSKNFSDNSVRKVKIYKIADGMLIGTVSTPAINGYNPSPSDSIGVMKTETGLKVSYMVNGVGILIELVEYRNNIGMRVHINSFNTCTGTGSIFSEGSNIFVQDGQSIGTIVLEPEIDCDKIYFDSW